MGWLSIVRLPKEKRTRSPFFTTHGSVPGNTRLLNVNRLKSFMMFGLGVAVPGSMNHSPSMTTKWRSTFGTSGTFGWMTKKPIMPIAIWTISSECGWYMNTPFCFSVNS